MRFLLLLVLVAGGACGGESQRREEEASGGSSGSPASVAGGAPSSGGQPATSQGCPLTPPSAFVATSCPKDVPVQGCRYALECESGPQSFTYWCEEQGWSVADEACEMPFDTCGPSNAQVRCDGGVWALGGHGGDGPYDCASERPAPGSACPWSPLAQPSTCGYRCADGTGWTVASCAFGIASTVWLLDGACTGDCSAFDRALFDYVNAHDACDTDADCRYMNSECAFARQHCSGAMAVGPSADSEELARLDAALSLCASAPGSGWSCGGCDAEPPPARCMSGRCYPG